MAVRTMLKRPSAVLPVAMSLIALTTVLVYLAQNGPAPQPDEGAAAHLWQLLMAGQVPIVAFFAVKWLPRESKPTFGVLALQAVAAVAALAPVFLLGW